MTWKAPFVFFILAILISARYGGRVPGLTATALSVLSGTYFFIEPRFSLRVAEMSDVLNLALFAVVGTALSLLCGQLRDALDRSTRERERLRAISDCVPQLLWTAEPDGPCDFVNARWCEYTGAPAVQLLGAGWQAYLHPDDLQPVARYWANALATGGAITSECRLRRGDGVYRWFETHAVPVRDADGLIVKWFGSNTDIQESRELRESLSAETERFARIVAAAPGVICKFALHPDGSAAMPFASPALHELYGLDPSEVATDAAPIFERIHPDDRQHVQETIGYSARSMSIWRAEFRVLHPEKGELWVSGQSAPVREYDGTINWYGFLSDITVRKRADEAVRQKTEREVRLLETLIENAPLGIVMLDRTMRHVEASPRWLAEVGQTREAVIGRNHYDCFPDISAKWKEAHRRGLAGETLVGRDEEFLAPDGSLHWVNWQISPWGVPGEKTGGIVIYSEDISERKRAEAAARRHEMEFRALFENMTEGLAYCRMIFENGIGTDFVLLAVNRQFESLTGLKNVVGKRIAEVFPGLRDSDPEIFEAYSRIAHSGTSERFEHFLKATGDWYSISAYSPEKGFFVATFDIVTQRKKAELAARQWQRAFEQSEIGIALADNATDIVTDVNAAFARRRGYTRAEIRGCRVGDIFPQDQRALVKAAVRTAESSGGHVMFESRHLKKDGGTIPVLVDLTLIRDEAGDVTSRVAFVQDLSAVKNAEDDLRERQHTISALLDSASQAIVAVDTHGKTVLLNRMAGEMFGYPPDDLIGQPLDMLLPQEVRGVHPTHLAGYFAQPRVRPMGQGLDLAGARRDGTRFPVEVSLSFIETRQGPLSIAFVNDITLRRQAEKQIRQLNRRLEQRVKDRTAQLEVVNRELEAFAYSVSHDLRAPLRGIDGWSLALLEDYGAQLDERAHKYLSRVRSETQRMGMLIDDLLQLSRVTRLEMHQGPVDISAIASDIAAKLREANPERQIDFVIVQHMTAYGDARLLEIALTNLMDNAVKFTGTRPTARIEVGETWRDGKPAFYVRDNGVGFEMKHATTLFGAFQRLHKVSEFPGTGIGLATVKRVVHRHGGEVWADAELGVGATFGFTLGRQDGEK